MYETSNLVVSTTSENNDEHTDKKKHKCDVCPKRFRLKCTLLRHKEIHTNEKTHKCDICSKLFLYKSNCVKHKEIHTNEKKHKCEVCSKLFLFKYNLVQHTKIHTNEKNHKCDVCSMLFHRKSYLVQHNKIHTNEKDFKCDVCLKLFRLKTTLLQHKTIHTNERKHKCDDCSMLFRTKFMLQQHKKTHTNGQRSYQCFECGKNFTCRDRIIRHLQLHKKIPFTCDKCKKDFISAVQLKNHYKMHMKERLFSCNLCGESFVGKRKLKSHIFMKHIHNDSEKEVILKPYNNSVSLREAKSECCNKFSTKSCNVVLERFRIENNVVYGIVGINSSTKADNVSAIEVKAELEESTSSESNPFNVSVIYKEEGVEDRISLTNGCIISSAIDEVKQENCFVKLENYDDVEPVWKKS